MRETLKDWAGRSLLSGRLRRLVLDRLRKEGISFVRQFEDHAFAFTPGDFIGECLLSVGEYQRDLVEQTMKIVSPKRILELGANIGTQTAYFFQYGAEHVTAVEPAPINLSQLHMNLKLNGLDGRVSVCALAASSKTGSVQFAQYRYNQGRSAIVNASVGDGEHDIISVPTERAENLVDFIPDLIWIDVEEHEIEAMKGLGRLLGRPMLVEFSRQAMSDEDFQWFVASVLPKYSRMRAYDNGFVEITESELGRRQYNLLLT